MASQDVCRGVWQAVRHNLRAEASVCEAHDNPTCKACTQDTGHGAKLRRRSQAFKQSWKTSSWVSLALNTSKILKVILPLAWWVKMWWGGVWQTVQHDLQAEASVEWGVRQPSTQGMHIRIGRRAKWGVQCASCKASTQQGLPRLYAHVPVYVVHPYKLAHVNG